MKNKWNVNGILIQGIKDINIINEKVPYIGIARYMSWPLSGEYDEVSKLLTTEAEEKWFNYYNGESFALEIVPSGEFVERYIELCNKKNINIRILSIETNREYPEWQGEDYNSIFLGYDYATSQDFFSALYDDLYGDETPELLTKYKMKLNKNGLFDEEKDLIEYINDRSEAIKQGNALETHGDFCMYKISLVI